MNKSESLYALAELVAAFEQSGTQVTELRPRDRSLFEDGGATATIDLDLPDPTDAVDHGDANVEIVDAAITDDADIRLSLDVRIDGEGPADNGSTGATDGPSPETGRASNRTETDETITETTETVGDATDEDPDQSDVTGAETGTVQGDDAADATPRATQGDDTAESEIGAPQADDAAENVARPTESEATAKDDNRTGESDDTPPAHRDPDRLRAVYAEDRTFEEMRDALGVEVTPQTVRKHMVKHGIHEPSSQGPSSGSGDESDGESRGSSTPGPDDGSETALDSQGPGTSEVVHADEATTDSEGDDSDSGTDAGRDGDDEAVPEDGTMAELEQSRLPAKPVDEIVDDVGIDRGPLIADIVRAVQNHRTLYGVQRALDLNDQAQTRTLLRELNLLDLVHGRLSSGQDGEVTQAEIEDRIQDTASD